jgi:hypothetical protein
MVQRIGGFDPLEIKYALEAFFSSQSAHDLEIVIGTLPVIKTRALHAILRQEYLRLQREHSPIFPDFEAKYHFLFFLLHRDAHNRLCQSVTPHQPIPPLARSSPFAPPFFSKLIDLLDGRLPPLNQTTFNPGYDLDLLKKEMSTILGEEVTIPDYMASQGSSWSAILVSCAACHHIRLSIRAYVINLSQAPELLEPLQQGIINNDACPNCGEMLCIPMRVWIQESPGTSDALESLSCVWLLTETLSVYQPPPGTQRTEENNHLIEIRFFALEDKILDADTRKLQCYEFN